MKDTVSHYVPPHSPLTSTEPRVFSNNLTMPLHARLVAEHERIAGGVDRAMAIGGVDEIIDPADTRRLPEALAAAPAGRGAHGNIPL